MAAEGMQFPWRWNGDTISLKLGDIWEMPGKIIRHYSHYLNPVRLS